MARAWKTLLRPGVYQAPQGELRVDAAWLRQRCEQFHAMKRSGIRIPVCWGHQPDAMPGSSGDRKWRQYELSRYNAGYIEDMRLHPETLELQSLVDVPGAEVDGDGNLLTTAEMPDGRKVRCAIREVSAAVRSWRDGSGREWPSTIVHLALVPLPVVDSQPGFQLEKHSMPIKGEMHLSLSALLYSLGTENAMHTDPEKKGAGDGGSPSHFQEVMEALKSRGISLPDDTNEESFFERMAVALHALNNSTDTGTTSPTPPVDEPLEPLDEPLDTEPEDEEEDEEEEVDATEEQRPLMMGTGTGTGKAGVVFKTPLERRLFNKALSEAREKRVARVKKLQLRGLPQSEAARLLEEARGYTLSLDPQGEEVEQRIDIELSALERVLPKKGFGDSHLARRTREAKRPTELDYENDADFQKFIEEGALRVSKK